MIIEIYLKNTRTTKGIIHRKDAFASFIFIVKYS